MKANELRIGNWLVSNVYYNSPSTSVKEDGCFQVNELSGGEYFCKVDSYEDMGASKSLYLNKCKPIPLTEEWLIKFGFNNLELLSMGTLEKTYELNGVILMKTDAGFLLCDTALKVIPKYVHQLQNLFFALTQEELIIKDTT